MSSSYSAAVASMSDPFANATTNEAQSASASAAGWSGKTSAAATSSAATAAGTPLKSRTAESLPKSFRNWSLQQSQNSPPTSTYPQNATLSSQQQQQQQHSFSSAFGTPGAVQTQNASLSTSTSANPQKKVSAPPSSAAETVAPAMWTSFDEPENRSSRTPRAAATGAHDLNAGAGAGSGGDWQQFSDSNSNHVEPTSQTQRANTNSIRPTWANSHSDGVPGDSLATGAGAFSSTLGTGHAGGRGDGAGKYAEAAALAEEGNSDDSDEQCDDDTLALSNARTRKEVAPLSPTEQKSSSSSQHSDTDSNAASGDSDNEGTEEASDIWKITRKYSHSCIPHTLQYIAVFSDLIFC